MMKVGDTIDEMRRRNGSGHAAPPAAAFDKIVDEHCNELVRIDEFASLIQNAESIGVTIGGEAELEGVLLHDALQLAELLVGGFGMMTTEVHVAIRVQDDGGDVLPPEKSVQIAGAGSVQRVVGKLEIRCANFLRVDLRCQVAEIGGANVDALDQRFTRFRRKFPVHCLKLHDFIFDFRGDFRESGSTIGGRKLQTVVLTGIVTGGDIDRAVEFQLRDRECDGRSRYGL